MYNKAGNFIYIQCSNNASYSLPVLWTCDQGSYPETEAVAFETEAKTEAVDPETEADARQQGSILTKVTYEQ